MKNGRNLGIALSLLGGFLLIASIMIVLPNGFVKISRSFSVSNSKIVGNGDIVSQNYPLTNQPFDSIELMGSGTMNVQVTHKPHTADATIKTDSNLLPYMEVYVKNKTLYLSSKDNYQLDWTKRNITVNAENLQSVTIHGSADSTIKNIQSDDFAMEIFGSGNASLQGSTKNLSVEINGSGDVNTKGLNAEEANLSLFGSGNIVSTVTQKIDVNICGSGSVEYYGNPKKVTQSISGSGTIVATNN